MIIIRFKGDSFWGGSFFLLLFSARDSKTIIDFVIIIIIIIGGMRCGSCLLGGFYFVGAISNLMEYYLYIKLYLFVQRCGLVSLIQSVF